MRRCWAFVVLTTGVAAAVACSSFSSNDDPGTPDSAVESGAVDDASADAGSDVVPDAADGGASCDPTTPFVTFQPIGELDKDGFDESTPRLTDDERTIVFESNQSAGGIAYDLYSATRIDRGHPWDTALPLANVSTGALEAHPWISKDGLRLIFARAVNPDPFDIYQSTRSTTKTDFDVATSPLQTVNETSSADFTPFLTHDSAELFFASNRSGESHIWVSATGAGGALQPPKQLVIEGVPLGSRHDTPVLSQDGTTMYFSLIEVDGGTGASHIWVATRSPTPNTFVDAKPVSEIKDGSDQLPGWLSGDKCRLYYTAQTFGGRDLYVASR
jgi:hypothetical protein